MVHLCLTRTGELNSYIGFTARGRNYKQFKCELHYQFQERVISKSGKGNFLKIGWLYTCNIVANYSYSDVCTFPLRTSFHSLINTKQHYHLHTNCIHRV
jgi:hypothetical protein